MGGQLQPELHAGPADVAEATTPPHGAAADPTVFSEPQPGHDHRWHTGNVLRARDAFNEPVPNWDVSELCALLQHAPAVHQHGSRNDATPGDVQPVVQWGTGHRHDPPGQFYASAATNTATFQPAT